jgi:hypothetical protein
MNKKYRFAAFDIDPLNWKSGAPLTDENFILIEAPDGLLTFNYIEAKRIVKTSNDYLLVKALTEGLNTIEGIHKAFLKQVKHYV